MTQALESMTRSVFVAAPDLPLRDAWTLMVRESFRHLPVVRGDALLGMVSDRDLLAHGRVEGEVLVHGDALTVADVMSSPPFTCEPATEVSTLVRVMSERKLDALPVVDAEGRLSGLVTSTDLLLLLADLEVAARPVPYAYRIETHIEG